MAFCPRGNFHRKPLLPAAWIRLGTAPANARPRQPASVTAWAKAPCSLTGSIQLQKNIQVSANCETRGSDSLSVSAMGTSQHRGHQHLVPSPVPGLASGFGSAGTRAALGPPPCAGEAVHPHARQRLPRQSPGCHSNRSVPAGSCHKHAAAGQPSSAAAAPGLTPHGTAATQGPRPPALLRAELGSPPSCGGCGHGAAWHNGARAGVGPGGGQEWGQPGAAVGPSQSPLPCAGAR